MATPESPDKKETAKRLLVNGDYFHIAGDVETIHNDAKRAVEQLDALLETKNAPAGEEREGLQKTIYKLDDELRAVVENPNRTEFNEDEERSVTKIVEDINRQVKSMLATPEKHEQTAKATPPPTAQLAKNEAAPENAEPDVPAEERVADTPEQPMPKKERGQQAEEAENETIARKKMGKAILELRKKLPEEGLQVASLEDLKKLVGNPKTTVDNLKIILHNIKAERNRLREERQKMSSDKRGGERGRMQSPAEEAQQRARKFQQSALKGSAEEKSPEKEKEEKDVLSVVPVAREIQEITDKLFGRRFGPVGKGSGKKSKTWGALRGKNARDVMQKEASELYDSYDAETKSVTSIEDIEKLQTELALLYGNAGSIEPGKAGEEAVEEYMKRALRAQKALNR